MPEVVVLRGSQVPARDRSIRGVRVTSELQELVREQPGAFFVAAEHVGVLRKPETVFWRGTVCYRKDEGVTLTMARTRLEFASEAEAMERAQAVLDEAAVAEPQEVPEEEPDDAGPVAEVVERAEPLPAESDRWSP